LSSESGLPASCSMRSIIAVIGKKWPQTVSGFGIGLGLGATLPAFYLRRNQAKKRATIKESLDAATAKGAKLGKVKVGRR
jgi:hypothetical protein